MDSASGDAAAATATASHHKSRASSNGAAAESSAAGGNSGSNRGTPNHHSGSGSAAQQAQAQAAAAAAALGLIDPSALFAHSLFASGIPASYNPMAPMPGYGLLTGQGGPSPFGSSSSSSSHNQANAAAQAAWWNMASQMAAQDYLARLQHAAVASASGGAGGASSGRSGASSASTFPGVGAGFPGGLSAADSLLASYTSAMNAASHSAGGSNGGAGKSSSSRKSLTSSSSSSSVVVRDSLSNQPIPSTSTASSSGNGNGVSGGSTRKSGSSSKSRRRSAMASVDASSIPTSSSLSSLSSMAMSYPFFGNPLASLSVPGMAAAAAAAAQHTGSPYASSSSAGGHGDDKKRRKTSSERHSSSTDPSSTQLLRLAGSVGSGASATTTTTTTTAATTNSASNNNNNGTKARSQTVNGKPLALDVSSLIGKPSTSSSSSTSASSTSAATTTVAAGSTTESGEAPLNLSMKTSGSKEDTTPASSQLSTASSRLGRGVSMPKKNTVASLLAQSRNQRSTSPHNNNNNNNNTTTTTTNSSPSSSSSSAMATPPAAHAASSVSSLAKASSGQPSSAELKAMSENLALYTAMQELSSGKFSGAYLNGIKDSLNPHHGAGTDPNHAIQDLLRAASLLGGFGFGPIPGLGNSSGSSGGGGGKHSGSSAKTDSASNAAAKGDTAKSSQSASHAENGQGKSSGNGKSSSHDDTLASDDSDSMEEDDSMIDSDDGWAGTGEGEGESRKRSADGGDGEGGDERPFKRRRFVSDEAALRVPLALGWKRETLIRAIGKSGVRGEVTYYSPSGRRFRQYPDVVRYLERQGIGNITRDNFSFSTRCIVGEFIQPLGESPNSRGIRLGEPEVRHLVDQIRIARGWKPRSRRMTEEEKEAIGRQREVQRAAQRVEAQEAARQAQEAKLQQRMERERALQEAKETRRQMREQEKLERQEAARRERELRNQQALEARKKRQEELDRLREEEQQRKLAELNKQRELFYTAELERERRRQHTAVVKALEARKRYEERERRREEMRAEKRAEREKKLEERRRELESWRDQRSPTEDLSLTDHKALPDLPRIKNLKLAGKAFADVLMLYEFLHTFGETLGFDMDSLPSLDSLQRALLYDSEAEEELLSVMTHLLVCAIEDPGIPHPNRHTTILGQTLKQADITTTNVSEILRLYLQANGLGDMKLPVPDKTGSNSDKSASTATTTGSNGSPAKSAPPPLAADYPDKEAFLMSEWLKRKPFLSLNPTQKAAILGFMVNELLQNKAVIGQIDGAIEGQNTARRDRWIVDSKIKKLKTLHSKKNRSSLANTSSHSLLPSSAKADHLADDSTTHDETNHSAAGVSGKKKEEAVEVEEHADEADDDSGADADDNADQGDEDEDENLPVEELKRKIERLSRQSAQMLSQLAMSDLQLRALNMGQDRYRRRLWILPHAGGVYCEALESAEANAGPLGTWDGKSAPPIAPMETEPTEPTGSESTNEKKDDGDGDGDAEMPQVPTEVVVKSEPISKEEPDAVQDKPEEAEQGGEATPSEDKENQGVVTVVKAEADADAVPAAKKNEEQGPVPVDPNEVEMKPIVVKEEEEATTAAAEVKSEAVALPALWFTLFPRTPCDDHSLVHAQAGDADGNGAADCADDRQGLKKEESAAKDEADKCEMFPIPEAMSRGWWRIVDPEQVKTYVDALHPRGVREKELSRMLTRFMDFAKESCLKGNPKDLLLKELKDEEAVQMLGGAPLPDAEGSWSSETSLRGDLLLLEQIEALEDRVASASMQVKGWKLPPRATTEMNLVFRTAGQEESEEEDDEDDSDDDDDEDVKKVNPVELAKERLLSVEIAIERRYLKAPLGQNKGDLVQSVLSGSCPSSEPPKALLTWREAVKRCETAAQVSMCFYVLETSVAWDKSIMKASCQFCHSGDKEDQLLLCDGCDKGYHTYCFRPPMDNIPDGDWFCYECRNKATGQRNCIVCGKPGSKATIVLCDQCPKAYHIECLQPPLAKVPRGKWLCLLCHSKSPAKTKKSAAKKSAASRERVVSESNDSSTNAGPSASTDKSSAHLNDTLTEASNSSLAASPGPSAAAAATPTGSSSAAPSPRRSSAAVATKRSLNQAIAKEKDLAPCRTILDQLEAHEEAWPFLLPVNTKQFPTYKKIIRTPMDLSTIRKKLTDGIYKTRDEFCADLHLMFVNCVTFNEDDSPVGKAGHSMKNFFDSRWAELIAH